MNRENYNKRLRAKLTKASEQVRRRISHLEIHPDNCANLTFAQQELAKLQDRIASIKVY